MKKDVGFICVGQAGGNIGQLFESKGYNVLYVNTSEEDLNTLRYANHKYHLQNGDGCAKDRDKAKQLLAEDLDNLISQIRATITQKYVFVVFSSGGGTGSGISPWLIEVLIDEFKSKEEISEDSLFRPEPEKYFAAATIIPGDEDKTQASLNSYNCCQELLEIEGLGSIFLLDNACGKEKLTINRIFADTLDHILEIPTKYKSVKGNVDKAELRKALFETPGVAIATYLSRDKGSTAQVIESARHTIYAPLERDKTILYYVTSTSTNLDMNAVSQEFGEPMDIFATYNEECNLFLMTGLTFPYTRFESITNRIKEQSAHLKKSIEALNTNMLSEDLHISSNMQTKKTRKTVKTVQDPNSGNKSETKTVTLDKPKKSARDMLSSYRRG